MHIEKIENSGGSRNRDMFDVVLAYMSLLALLAWLVVGLVWLVNESISLTVLAVYLVVMISLIFLSWILAFDNRTEGAVGYQIHEMEFLNLETCEIDRIYVINTTELVSSYFYHVHTFDYICTYTTHDMTRLSYMKYRAGKLSDFFESRNAAQAHIDTMSVITSM